MRIRLSCRQRHGLPASVPEPVSLIPLPASLVPGQPRPAIWPWCSGPGPSAEPYAHALQALAALARHEVQGRQRKRQEADNLREAVAHEAVLQTAPVLINAFGDDGKCLLWNEECERRFGWSMEEVNAHPEPLALFYPDPVVLARGQASVSDEPSRLFREWHPQTRCGEVLSTIW